MTNSAHSISDTPPEHNFLNFVITFESALQDYIRLQRFLRETLPSVSNIANNNLTLYFCLVSINTLIESISGVAFNTYHQTITSDFLTVTYLRL